jgi:hypothetical protein
VTRKVQVQQPAELRIIANRFERPFHVIAIRIVEGIVLPDLVEEIRSAKLALERRESLLAGRI